MSYIVYGTLATNPDIKVQIETPFNDVERAKMEVTFQLVMTNKYSKVWYEEIKQ